MAHWNRIAVPPRRRSNRAAIASLRRPVNSASGNSSNASEAIRLTSLTIDRQLERLLTLR